MARPRPDTPDTPDTAERSLAHWSEEGRAEMEAFYALARLDYQQLAQARDWPATLRDVHARRGGSGPLTLLDVACGSGKFPAALQLHGGVGELAGELEVAYDLLDPSAFSLQEAAGELRPPFAERDRFEVTLEDLDPAAGPWDVVWATHALYALEPAKVDAAMERFLAAVAPGGLGVIAQGGHDGHYHAVYAAYRADAEHEVTPYVRVEELTEALRRAGAEPQVERLTYDHVVRDEDEGVLEGYLQRCLFDDRLSLADMRAAPALGAYLRGCHDEAAGVHRFTQQVDLVVLAPTTTPTGGPR